MKPVFDGGPSDAASLDNRLREPLDGVFDRVAPTWRAVTDAFRTSADGQALIAHVDRRVRDNAVVYPRQVLRALEFGPPESIRVVILGQDPYHGAGQAQGLAFSVAPGHRPLPPSLRNILKEVAAETGQTALCRDDLSPWAEQGVLLLNTVLTVEDATPQSHATRGWEALTDALIRRVAASPDAAVFMLWGASAQKKRPLVGRPGPKPHLVLEANHPSPLSARRPPVPFSGCGHFVRAAEFLAGQRPGEAPIRW